jgi:ArsR family transcriptional regulator
MAIEAAQIDIQARSAGCCAPSLAPQLSDAQAQAGSVLLKALADPTRLQIVDLLLQQPGESCVCDFEGRVGLPDEQTGQRPRQPTISHHLRVLREAGIVDCTKRGLWAYYFVLPERIETVRAVLGLVG